MALIIGSEGLVNADLIIPQGSSLYFTITHLDEQGNVIDHSQSQIELAVQEPKNEKITYMYSIYCSADSEKIIVDLPPSVSENLKIGSYNWDLFITTQYGQVIRAVYGKVKILDTYVPDGR